MSSMYPDFDEVENLSVLLVRDEVHSYSIV